MILFNLFIEKQSLCSCLNKEWFEIFLDKQMEHKFYTIFLISQMT